MSTAGKSSASRPSASPLPRQPTSTVNTQSIIIDHGGARIVAVADIRGRVSQLNELAKEADAKAIIHTGDFGFFGTRCRAYSERPVYWLAENSSLSRINDR